MGKYILKRILFFIPTLIIISLLAFFISASAPGDPLNQILGGNEDSGPHVVQAAQRDIWRKKLGLDLPLFYCSIGKLASPDTLYKISDPPAHDALARMISRYGNWSEISVWYRNISSLAESLHSAEADSATTGRYGAIRSNDLLNYCRTLTDHLGTAYDDTYIRNHLALLRDTMAQYAFMGTYLPLLARADSAYRNVIAHKTPYKNYIPVLHWHTQNRYARWLFGDGNWITGKGSTYSRGLIRGDFGYSYQTKLPVSDVIAAHIKWSLLLTLISVLLAYLISIPIGLKAAAGRNALFDRSSSVILFILYSMPVFWVATLLLMNFANPYALQWFPPSGVGPATGIPEGTSFLKTIGMRLPYLVLPTITYTYAQLAFLSRITRVSALEVLSQDYIRTARAKGLPESKILFRHTLRNILLPLITVFSNVFPLVIGGSVIIETVFNIPGMGQQIYQAIGAQDYPVIIDVFTLTGVLTLLGYLVADILYAVADPRISFHYKQG